LNDARISFEILPQWNCHNGIATMELEGKYKIPLDQPGNARQVLPPLERGTRVSPRPPCAKGMPSAVKGDYRGIDKIIKKQITNNTQKTIINILND